jgi:hypothetical protein
LLSGYVEVRISADLMRRIGSWEGLWSINPKRDVDSNMFNLQDNAKLYEEGNGLAGLFWAAHWRNVLALRRIHPTWDLYCLTGVVRAIKERFGYSTLLITHFPQLPTCTKAFTGFYKLKKPATTAITTAVTPSSGTTGASSSSSPPTFDVDTYAAELDKLEATATANGGRLPTVCFKSFEPKRCIAHGVTKAQYEEAVVADKNEYNFMSDPPFAYAAPKAQPKADIGLTMHKSHVRRTGPLLRQPVVFNTRSQVTKLAGAEGRSDPNVTADTGSSAYARFSKAMESAVKNVFTDQRIDEVLLNISSWDAAAYGKFTWQEVNDAKDRWLLKGNAAERKASLKDEVVFKTGKFPRQIQDEGINLFVVNQIVGTVFQEILFGHGTIGEDASIKHRPKADRLDEIASELRTCGLGIKEKLKKPCVLEVDQTGMELHTRCRWSKKKKKYVGNFSFVYQIYHKILERMKVQGNDFPMISGFECSLEEMKNGVYFVIKPSHAAAKLLTPKPIQIRFEDVYMLSGNLMTSAANFLNEFVLTLASVARNPEKLFDCITVPSSDLPLMSTACSSRVISIANALGKQESAWFHADKFDWKFLSAHETITDAKGAVHPVEIVIRLFIEGDDVIGCSEGVKAFQTKIEEAFRALGMDTKLKLVETGRAEFVGTHFVCVDGILGSEWTPDFARTLGKVGVTLCADDAKAFDVILARYASLALMFRGRDEAMYTLLKNLFFSWYTDMVARSVDLVDLHGDIWENPGLLTVDTVDRIGIQGNFKVPLQSIVDVLNEKVSFTSVAEACRLLGCSLEADISQDEYVKMLGAFSGVTRHTTGGDLVRYLPISLVKNLPLK